jgi:hypothetical protein
LTKDSVPIDANIAAEVTSRLDEIFLEDEPRPAPVPGRSALPTSQPVTGVESDEDAVLDFSDEPELTAPEKASGVVPSGGGVPASQDPLAELNAVFLSVDWEITDENMAALIAEVQRLKAAYQNDRMSAALLDVLNVIGKYVARNKADSIPDSIKLLHSVFESLKTFFQFPQMEPMDKKRLLGQHLHSLKRLREEMAVRSGKVAVPRVREATAPAAGGLSDRDMGRLLEAIKPMILAEVQKLVSAEMQRQRSGPGR